MSNAPLIPFPGGTKKREIEYVMEQYYKAHPDEDPSEAVPDLIAEWAYQKGLWKRPPVDPVVALSRDISRHLRNEYVTDEQGRTVRKNHAVFIEVQTPAGPKKRSIWKELFHAPAEHMKASFQLRRRAAFRDVQQLHLDFESYKTTTSSARSWSRWTSTSTRTSPSRTCRRRTRSMPRMMMTTS